MTFTRWLKKIRHFLPLPWLLCDGATVARIKCEHLFSVVGTSYGVGDHQTIFNLHDFHGRFSLGVGKASPVGVLGENNTVELTTKHLPSHSHSADSLSTLVAGNHSHSYQDPGHDHGGRTGNGQFDAGGYKLGKDGNRNSYTEHSHTISRDTTHITIEPVKENEHQIEGQPTIAGSGKPFSVIPPYQTVIYIIYTD
ncbi:unnamed protein product [Rotaria socialis]|uniref:Phage tail collar domain-containing protein n=1 Tax=Rotaria socialis TaxID=392032 RepID=A0A821SA43_9BILA|nr:unnamed protein product [Rotaria socialis]